MIDKIKKAEQALGLGNTDKNCWKIDGDLVKYRDESRFYGQHFNIKKASYNFKTGEIVEPYSFFTEEYIPEVSEWEKKYCEFVGCQIKAALIKASTEGIKPAFEYFKRKINENPDTSGMNGLIWADEEIKAGRMNTKKKLKEFLNSIL